jgi:hypothetical protein
MPNDVLRRALAESKLTERQLAEQIGADPKTVSRWVSDDDRLPHARLRWAVSDVLGVDEMTLWPRAARAALKTGPDREIVAVYPTRSAMPRSVRQQIVAQASRDLTFVVFTGYSLWADIPGFSDTLRAKVAAGARVRFIVGDANSEQTRLTEDAEGTPLTISARIGHTLRELEALRDIVEVRQTFLCWGKGVTRCDDDAILTMSVFGRTGTDAPRLHLRRKQTGGIFDQMAVLHAEALWDVAQPIWQ